MIRRSSTREDAFAVADSALDLAQNLTWYAATGDPKRLRLRYKLSRKKLMVELVAAHALLEHYAKDAYELYNQITDLAGENPLERENKK